MCVFVCVFVLPLSLTPLLADASYLSADLVYVDLLSAILKG